MKSTTFHLTDPSYEDVMSTYDLYNEVFIIPTLPAYAIISHTLDCLPTNLEGTLERPNYRIDGNSVRINHIKFRNLNGETTGTLTINYSGIRDYKLLFPHVEDDNLKERLGQFAEEADKAFEAGAWMSFAVMVASVIEGVLFNVYGNARLKSLINKAKDDERLSIDEAELLHSARNIRNAIHAGRFKDAIADRTIGNDLYVMYDHLIKKNWE